MNNEHYVINENSWHWRFYRWYSVMNNEMARLTYFYGEGNPSLENLFDHYCYKPYDFCQYWRGVLLWPPIKFAFAAAIAVFALFAATFSLTDGIALYLYFASAVVIVSTLIMLVGGTSLLWVKFWGQRNSGKEGAESGLIEQAYKSYKNKYCPAVTYTKGDE